MRVWRLTKQRHAKLDGEGARIYGSRWNSLGKAVVYTASSLSLALLEQLVRIDPDEIPSDFVSIAIDIPETLAMTHISLNGFPQDWRNPEQLPWFRNQGDHWLDKQETAILKVPSVIVTDEMNVLLNPMHSDIKQIKVLESKPFAFDTRLF